MPYADPVVRAAKNREYGKAYRAKHADRLRGEWREKAKKRKPVPKDSAEYRRRQDLRNVAARKRRAANRDKARAIARAFAHKWRTEKKPQHDAWWKAYRLKRPNRHVKYRYGISEAQWDVMYQAQGGRCAICATAAKRMDVDHDHSTGAVRALLCQKCNRGLGQFNDDASLLVQASAYLKHHTKAVA
jgi:hypothetical protein